MECPKSFVASVRIDPVQFGKILKYYLQQGVSVKSVSQVVQTALATMSDRINDVHVTDEEATLLIEQLTGKNICVPTQPKRELPLTWADIEAIVANRKEYGNGTN